MPVRHWQSVCLSLHALTPRPHCHLSFFPIFCLLALTGSEALCLSLSVFLRRRSSSCSGRHCQSVSLSLRALTPRPAVIPSPSFLAPPSAFLPPPPLPPRKPADGHGCPSPLANRRLFFFVSASASASASSSASTLRRPGAWRRARTRRRARASGLTGRRSSPSRASSQAGATSPRTRTARRAASSARSVPPLPQRTPDIIQDMSGIGRHAASHAIIRRGTV